MDASQIPAVLPFSAARAYGVRPGAMPVTPSAPVDALTRQVKDRADLSGRAISREKIDAIVAATVERDADFAPGPVARTADTIPMYRHPADRNAAAVGVDVGRRLDVQG
jgi:hypothetical protein